MTRPPIIGVAGALERARWSVWDLEAVLVPRNYLDAITAAGGVPMIIPPLDALDAGAALEVVDALLLVGGSDVDPGSYGAEAHPETAGSVPERDRAETALVRVAWDRDLPFLGICRGMQMLNIARGGDLRQHLPDDVGHGDHRRVIGTFDDADHDVTLAAGSLAAQAAGETDHSTKSHHHQGVGSIGEGLDVTGWAVGDELPEALEAPDRTFVLGVQWHPEADETSRVIGTLVAEARDRIAAAEGATA